MDWFRKRLTEPSSWAGLALSVAGVGQLGKIAEAPGVADAIGAGAQHVATTGDWASALVMTLGGVVATFARERGDRF